VQDRKRAQQVEEEFAIVVRVCLPTDPIDFNPLEEVHGLAETAGANVISGMTQRREKPDPATYLGKGKVEELKQLVEFHAADVVIFDNDLSPAQNRNLEVALETKVLDRTELILDIFATHAQTYESRLAVELAQLEYSLPRLKRMWTHLSRLKMGVGMRGPGEKQLETGREAKRASGRLAKGNDDGLVGWLYQRGQEYVDELADPSQGSSRRQTVCDSRHADQTLGVAQLGSCFA